MAASIQQASLNGWATCLPRPAARVQDYQQAYEEHRHRVYTLAFLMTDNEVVAEDLTVNTFCRAFAVSPDPGAEVVDRALIAELREFMPLGTLTLDCAAALEVLGARRNVKRVHLERAVVQLPATERLVFLLHDVEGYNHARIARTLGIGEQESVLGLHQARLRLRQLLVALS